MTNDKIKEFREILREHLEDTCDAEMVWEEKRAILDTTEFLRDKFNEIFKEQGDE